MNNKLKICQNNYLKEYLSSSLSSRGGVDCLKSIKTLQVCVQWTGIIHFVNEFTEGRGPSNFLKKRKNNILSGFSWVLWFSSRIRSLKNILVSAICTARNPSYAGTFDLHALFINCTRFVLTIYQTKPNIGQNLWVLAENAYGLWVIADLWVMDRNFQQTNSVDKIFYGV